MKTIYEKCKKAGLQMDSHESDLYVIKNEVSEKIVSEYEHKENVKVFTSQIDKKAWYDIPFAYDPFWDKKRS
jgi:hypothetical protein